MEEHENLSFNFDESLALKRTRDPKILDTCDIVVDVGAVYDESKQRFDHHQRGFQEVLGHGFNTKLSSAGLVYKSITQPCPRMIISNRNTDILGRKSSLLTHNYQSRIPKSNYFG
jgi:uncharacterized UPF0160 family protein